MTPFYTALSTSFVSVMILRPHATQLAGFFYEMEKKTLLLEIFSNMNYEVLLRVGWSLERLAETAEEAIL